MQDKYLWYKSHISNPFTAVANYVYADQKQNSSIFNVSSTQLKTTLHMGVAFSNCAFLSTLNVYLCTKYEKKIIILTRSFITVKCETEYFDRSSVDYKNRSRTHIVATTTKLTNKKLWFRHRKSFWYDNRTEIMLQICIVIYYHIILLYVTTIRQKFLEFR